MDDDLDFWTPQPSVLDAEAVSNTEGNTEYEHRPASPGMDRPEEEPEPMERSRARPPLQLPIRTIATTFPASSSATSTPLAVEENVITAAPINNAVATPVPEAPVSSPRALSRDLEGNYEEAPTACWENYHHEPRIHHLMCNHLVTTRGVRPCGSNCRTSSTAESKPYGNHYDCKKCAAMFIPRRKKKQPLRTLPGRIAKTNNMFSTVKGKDEESDTVFVEADEIKKEPGADGSDQLSTKKQRLDPAKEEPDEALKQLIASMNDRKRTILMPREILNLQVDGTDALWFHGPRPKRAVDSPFFSTPDREFGEEPAAKRRRGESPTRRAERRDAAVSRPEDGKLYCSCNNPWDGSLESCSICDEWFHPACLGQEERQVGKKAKRDRFLCLECKTRQDEDEVLATPKMRRSKKPLTVRDMRAATMKKREATKALKARIERERVEEMYGEDARDRSKKPMKAKKPKKGGEDNMDLD